MDNSIKKFRCDHCKEQKFNIRYICSQDHCGYMCDNCWNEYFDKVYELFRFLQKN